MQLLWKEYRDANPDGYRYSRFCELYQRWRKKLDVVMRQEHKAGEKAFIDWAGSRISHFDPLVCPNPPRARFPCYALCVPLTRPGASATAAAASAVRPLSVRSC